MLIQKIIAISFLLLFYNAIPAQKNAPEKDSEEWAIYHIRQLRQGYLTVVFESHIRKLNQLYQLSQSEAVSARKRQRALEEYTELINRREEFNFKLADAMEAYFEFCPYQVIYDYQLRTDDPKMNYSKTEPHPYQELEGKEYRLRIGRTKEAEQFGIEALVITDEEGNDLSDPFPYYVVLNKRTWLDGLISIFNPKGYKRKDPRDLVHELQQKLESYFEEVN